MTVHHTLMCFFFLSALQDGVSGFVPSTFVYAVEGGDVQVSRSFPWTRDTKFFCKEECEKEDVLMETANDTAQSGRYTIKFWKSLIGREPFLSVTITNLTKSDSGQYGYGLKDTSESVHTKFEINVEDAFLDGNPPEVKTLHAKTTGEIIVACPTSTPSSNLKFFCKDSCAQDILLQTTYDSSQDGRYSIRYNKGSSPGGSLHVSIKELNESDSGWYLCGMVRPLSQESFRRFKIVVSDDPAAARLGPIRLDYQYPDPAATRLEPTPPASLSPDSKRDSTPPPAYQSPVLMLHLVVFLPIAVIILAVVLIVICIRMKRKPDGSRTGGNSGGANVESELYENCSPDPPCGDSTYESLDPSGRDQNQTYSTLTRHN